MKFHRYPFFFLLLCMAVLAEAQSHAQRLEALDKKIETAKAGEKTEQLIAYLEEAYRLSSDKAAIPDSLTGSYLYQLGAAYELLQKDAEALKAYAGALALFKRKGEQPEKLLELQLAMANLEDLMGRPEAAAQHLSQAEALMAQHGWLRAKHQVRLIVTQAQLHHSKGNYEEALAKYEKALPLQTQKQGNGKEFYARLLNDVSVLHYEMANYPKAAELLRESARIRKKIDGPQSLAYAESIGNLAAIYRNLGQYTQAQQLSEEALSIRRKELGEKHPRYINSLANLGLLYQDLGYYEKAEDLYQKSLRHTEESTGKNSQNYILALNNLAGLYNKMGRKEEASLQLEEALPITADLIGTAHPFYAQLQGNLATLYMLQGKRELAETHFLKALASFEKSEQQASRAYIELMKSWSAFLIKEKRYDEALAIRQQLVQNITQRESPDGPNAIESRIAVANIFRLKDDYEAAIRGYQAVLLATAAQYGEKEPHHISALLQLATTYAEKGETLTAWQRLQEAAQLCVGLPFERGVSEQWVEAVKAQQPVDQVLQIEIYSLADRLLAEAPNQEEARYRLGKLLIHLHDNWRNDCNTKEDKLHTLASSSNWVASALGAMPNHAKEEAFLLADRQKALLLLEDLQSEVGYTFGGIPDSLRMREQDLLKKRSKTKALLQESGNPQEQKRLLGEMNATNRSLDELRRLLANKYPRYAAFKRMDYQLDVSAIQAALPKATALLEYVITEEELVYFYIDENRLEVFKRPVSRDTLREQIRLMRKIMSEYLKNDIQVRFDRFCQLSHWFYNLLLKPALQEAVGIERLIIVPDGELAHLPFETFLVELPKRRKLDYRKLHYLLQDYSFSYNYSAKLWMENLSQDKELSSAEMFALAAYYNKDADEELQSQRLPTYRSLRKYLSPLPEARKEVLRLSERYAGQFLTDSAATEHFFKQEAGNYGILHLAMHGLLNVQRPLLSSLAFTEDGDSSENNFLQAYEISSMNLNASLVVLSACETGYGTYEQGNGTASLARSFMYAGVPALVVSLWQVNDASTSRLMELFYENIAAGTTKDEALRQAKLRLIQEADMPLAAHPALWAPFIQMGNSRPIALDQKQAGTGLWTWLLGGAGLLLAGLAVAGLRRRKEV